MRTLRSRSSCSAWGRRCCESHRSTRRWPPPSCCSCSSSSTAAWRTGAASARSPSPQSGSTSLAVSPARAACVAWACPAEGGGEPDRCAAGVASSGAARARQGCAVAARPPPAAAAAAVAGGMARRSSAMRRSLAAQSSSLSCGRSGRSRCGRSSVTPAEGCCASARSASAALRASRPERLVSRPCSGLSSSGSASRAARRPQHGSSAESSEP